MFNFFTEVEYHSIGQKVKCATYKGTSIVKEELLQVLNLMKRAAYSKVDDEDDDQVNKLFDYPS